jgi:hypothetical protein
MRIRVGKRVGMLAEVTLEFTHPPRRRDVAASEPLGDLLCRDGFTKRRIDAANELRWNGFHQGLSQGCGHDAPPWEGRRIRVRCALGAWIFPPLLTATF